MVEYSHFRNAEVEEKSYQKTEKGRCQMNQQKKLSVVAQCMIMGLIIVLYLCCSCGSSGTRDTNLFGLSGSSGDVSPTVSPTTPTISPEPTHSPIPSNSPFTPVPWPTLTWVVPPRNLTMTEGANTFVWQNYNIDGSLKTNPCKYVGQTTVNNEAFELRTLTTNNTLAVNGDTYTVYSVVPDTMTIDYAYQNATPYYIPTDTNIPAVVKNTGKVNTGSKSGISSTASASAYGAGEPVYVAQNAAGSGYFIPNLANGRNADGTYTDRYGVTEHVTWTVDPYVNNSTYNPPTLKNHSLSYGWAYPSTELQQEIDWNKMNNSDLNADGNPLALKTGVTNSLLQTVSGAFNPALFTNYVNATLGNLASGVNSPWNIQATPTWLNFGAFINLQPYPGFQRNLRREYTPVGAWTLPNNTCDLFMRGDGSVEVPSAVSNGQATQPYPLVSQTWIDQMFTVINLTNAPIPQVNDQYPGEEAYYLGNTYLPVTSAFKGAGVLTRWTHYPNMMRWKNAQGLGSWPDERDADAWLGLRGDAMKDTMAWNQGDHPNDLGWYENGAQARKPYMIGAGDIISAAMQHDYTMRLEHSNTFFWYQVASSDSSLSKMYKATLWIDPGDGTYRKVATVWNEWMAWSFNYTSVGNPYRWVKQVSTLGTWVQRAEWHVTTQSGSPASTPQAAGFPTGWLNFLAGTGQGQSGQANLDKLAGPTPQGAGGAPVINLICNQANLQSTTNLQDISWDSAAGMGPNQMGSPVYKYTISSVCIDIPSVKYLVVLDEIH